MENKDDAYHLVTHLYLNLKGGWSDLGGYLRILLKPRSLDQKNSRSGRI